MGQFFVEGGWAMYPVLILSIVLVGSAGRYAVDCEPVRLRFIGVLALSLIAFIVTGLVANVATVFKYLQNPEQVSDAMYLRILAEGLKESSRPAVLGFLLLGVALIFVSIGVYRAGSRELAAARG